MKLVIMESPYAGDIEENKQYAVQCMRDSLAAGEAPLASHLLYTHEGLLDDSIPEERSLGIAAGLAWLPFADILAVYTDRGISRGMASAIQSAILEGVEVQYRSIGG